MEKLRLAREFRSPKKGIRERCQAFHDYLQQESDSPNWPFGRGQRGRHDQEVQIGAGRSVTMFASNDYLGLGQHPKIQQAIRETATTYGTGSAGSPLLSGNYKVSSDLQRKLAQLHQKEAGVLFNSTYAANLGVIEGLLNKRGCLVLDAFAHASIRDGARMAGCRTRAFRHNDPEHLQELLSEEDPNRTIVFIDSVYSMEGATCNLSEICRVVRDHGSFLAVDEAHALGVMGPAGEGVVASSGLSAQVDLITGSLGKSLASHGGYVVADASVCNFLRYNAHPCIFSSGLPPVNAAVALASLQVMEEETSNPNPRNA